MFLKNDSFHTFLRLWFYNTRSFTQNLELIGRLLVSGFLFGFEFSIIQRKIMIEPIVLLILLSREKKFILLASEIQSSKTVND